jgi:AraC-like DNA-binding protein
MDGPIRAKVPYGKFALPFFSGAGKYFMLQRITLCEYLPPSLEDESIFLYVVAGNGTITTNGIPFTLEPGAFMWIHSYLVYSIKPVWGEQLELFTCVYDYPLMFYLNFQGHTLQAIRSFADNPPIVYLDAAKQRRAEGLFAEFDAESQNSDRSSGLIKTAIYGQLAILFLREQDRTVGKLVSFRRTLAWNILLYLASFSNLDLRVQDVAKLFDISAARLNQEIRMISGYNFIQFLNRTRVNLASTILLFQELPLRYIISYVGYSSEVSFYRAFKAVKGMTPQEYRDWSTAGSKMPLRHLVNETSLSIFQYVFDNYREPISIKTVAQQLYLSENVINTSLKENFDMSFQGLVTNLRMRYASALLSITELPVLDVAVAAGFNSTHTFARLFKKEKALTPSEYRSRYREKPS